MLLRIHAQTVAVVTACVGIGRSVTVFPDGPEEIVLCEPVLLAVLGKSAMPSQYTCASAFALSFLLFM